MIQILGHGDQMILSGQSCTSKFTGRTCLDIREIEPNVGLGGHKPLLVTSFGQSFDDIRLVTHQSQQTHDLLSACSDSASSARLSESCDQDLPPQHVTLFGILDNQDQFINTVDLVLDTLNQRTKGIGDIIDKGVRDPVGRDGDVVLELLDTSPDILRVWRASEVELPSQHEGNIELQ